MIRKFYLHSIKNDENCLSCVPFIKVNDILYQLISNMHFCCSINKDDKIRFRILEVYDKTKREDIINFLNSKLKINIKEYPFKFIDFNNLEFEFEDLVLKFDSIFKNNLKYISFPQIIIKL